MIDPRWLAEALNRDGVAFADQAIDDSELQRLQSIIGDDVGVIIAPPTGASGVELRNLAQDVLPLVEPHTVIAISPESAAVVSNELSRARIEAAQSYLFLEPDRVVGIQNFLNEANSFGMPWAWLAVIGVAVVVGAVVATWLASSRWA